MNPVFDGARRETAPGTTGMLVNGTEISNYKSGDVIFFGGIESIDVLEGGSQFDVITPPTVSVESLTGAGVSATANVKGQFERIDVIDPGFDYVAPPVVEISGGNGRNAIARARLKQVDHFMLTLMHHLLVMQLILRITRLVLERFISSVMEKQ